MLVKDLLTLLKKCDPNTELVVVENGENEVTYRIGEVYIARNADEVVYCNAADYYEDNPKEDEPERYSDLEKVLVLSIE